MEFIITSTHGATITFKDYNKAEYVVKVSCPGKSDHSLVITKEQFRRLAKAS